jgi:hypothetical protein
VRDCQAIVFSQLLLMVAIAWNDLYNIEQVITIHQNYYCNMETEEKFRVSQKQHPRVPFSVQIVL